MKIKETIENHKITSLIVVIIASIIIARIIVNLHDPNIVIRGFELHHFYYGIILLIISSILMLYQRTSFQTNLLLSGVGIGLIIDEFIFIIGVMPNEKYSSTWPSVVILSTIILLIVEFVFYKINKKKTQKKK